MYSLFLHYVPGRSCYNSEGKLFCAGGNAHESYPSRKKSYKFDMKTSTNSGLSWWNYHEKQRDNSKKIKHIGFVPKTFQCISLQKHPNKFVII